MNQQQFRGQIRQCFSLLRHLGLLQRPVNEPNYEGVAAVRRASYREQWTHYLSNSMYDFLLTDWSLIQMELLTEDNQDKYRYVFLDCPYQSTQTFEQFSIQSKIRIKSELEEAYFSFLEEECEEKSHVRQIRYDYTPTQYVPGVHPASHVHLGCANEYRISTRKKLRPLAFAMFVARHIYPQNWQLFLNERHRAQYGPHVRNRLTDVADGFFGEDDQMELHLY